MEKKYSIIIPHYNDVSRLYRLLHSIPMSRGDIQVMVVDDCSPDQSLLKTIKDNFSKVQWLSTPVNSGAGAARNIGLDRAIGKWVLFADSDDEFTHTAFQAIDDCIDDNVDLIYFLIESKHEGNNGKSIRGEKYNKLVTNHHNNPSKRNLNLLRKCHSVPYGKVYRNKSILKEQIKFKESVIYNDMHFCILTAFAFNFINTEIKYIYTTYRRPGSMNENRSIELFYNRLDIHVDLANLMYKNGIKEKLPANHFLLDSIGYGVGTSIKTLHIIMKSHLSINILNFFNIKKWIYYLNKKIINSKEKINLNKK